jgi:hypothetical protein
VRLNIEGPAAEKVLMFPLKPRPVVHQLGGIDRKIESRSEHEKQAARDRVVRSIFTTRKGRRLSVRSAFVEGVEPGTLQQTRATIIPIAGRLVLDPAAQGLELPNHHVVVLLDLLELGAPFCSQFGEVLLKSWNALERGEEWSEPDE